MCTEKGQNPTEKFTVPWLFSMDSHSPGFLGSSLVSTHLTPICHPISCTAPTASVPSRRKLEAMKQNAVIITLSTSSLKLPQGAAGNSSELNSTSSSISAGFLHSSNAPHEEHFNLKPRTGALKQHGETRTRKSSRHYRMGSEGPDWKVLVAKQISPLFCQDFYWF